MNINNPWRTETQDDARAKLLAKMGSDNLLKAVLSYGDKHDGHLSITPAQCRIRLNRIGELGL